MSALPPVPQVPQQQAQPAADPSQMLQAMGGQGGPQQGSSQQDAAMQIQQQFVELSQGLQSFMGRIQVLAQQFPAFGPHVQTIAQCAQDAAEALNQGMMESIQQLRSEEPQAPMSQY